MTQVKLWQIVSQSANAIVFSDANGNLTSLPAGGPQQLLIAGPDGTPMWADNTALTSALEAKTDAASALANAKAYTEAQIAALVDNAPVALNTLNELALKLNGEDSAINALLIQVDGKAEKTELDTQVAQAKQDVTYASQQYTNTAVSTAMDDVASQIATTNGNTISTAQMDASSKADAAQNAAVASANDFTTQSIAIAAQEASDDATAKAATAQAAAISDAHQYTDGAVTVALEAASNDAQAKAESTQVAAAFDASAKVNALQAAIPTLFQSQTTTTACFLANSTQFEEEEAQAWGIPVAQVFQEITSTGASVNESSLNVKLLFVNGVAMGNEWQAQRSPQGELRLKFQQQLHSHVFDGTSNSVMLFVEFNRSAPLIAIEQPQ